MIRLDMPNIITIALAGMLGYGVLVGFVKIKQMIGSGAAASG